MIRSANQLPFLWSEARLTVDYPIIGDVLVETLSPPEGGTTRT